MSRQRPPPWWRARTLAERHVEELPLDDASARRLARWRSDFPDEDALAARLRPADLAPTDLPSVLAGAELPPATAVEPAWWRWTMEALESGCAARLPEGDDASDAELMRGCVRLVAPLARAAFNELAERAEAAMDDAPRFATRDTARLVAEPLLTELARLSMPVVALELQAARIARALPGASAQERAARFLRVLGSPERARELFAEHPALTRLLCERARLAVDAGAELLERLAADWQRLSADLFGGRDPGALCGVEPLGDPHDGGRRVLRLDFSAGGHAVYKARSLAVDAAYAALLRWLERAGLDPAPRAPAGIDAGPSHGWQEWVEVAPCTSLAEVERYFRRLGAQLAVLHALHGVDVHQENVIASGEHPRLIDLECLLHPRLGGARADAVDPMIAETAMGCVLRVGLLPRADVVFGVDLGGLARDPAGEVDVEAEDWLADGTDEVRLGRRRIELHPGANAPTLDGRPVRPHEHVDPLADGFACAHRLLCRHRDELLGPGGPLAAFTGVAIRVILRPTKVYVELLRRQASDPAALDDGLAREEVLNALWRGVRRRPDLGCAAAAEHHDLSCGDVPKLTTRPGSADGHHHALGRLPGLLGPHRTPSPNAVRRLDDADLERQLAFVRASVVAAAADLPEPGHPVPAPAPAPDSGRLLDAARAAARRLEVLALRGGDEAGWLAPARAPGHPGRVLRATGPGLADGQAGVALFLAELGAATGDGSLSELARAAVDRLLATVADGVLEAKPGWWSGAGGVLWALAHLADALRDPALVDRAVDLAADHQSWAERAERLDVAGGLAGWALGLAAVLARRPDGRLRAEAERCAERLRGAPRTQAGGLLDGMAGRELALLRLTNRLERREQGARVGPNARAAGDDGSWATGAAGRAIALTALSSYPSRPEEEAGTATAAAALDKGLGRDHSLATGDLGVLCAVDACAAASGDRDLQRRNDRLVGATLAVAERHGLRCAGPGGVEAPGLLTGIAGMGAAWLDLAERRPSAVLTLATGR